MTTDNVLFAGFKSVRLDSSLRLSIPAHWRRRTGDLLYLFFSRESGHPVIKVITRSFFDEKMKSIMTQDNVDAHEKARQASKWERLTREVRPDTRNRITIPSDMGELLGLEKPGAVTFAGLGDHFEIWRPEEFESFLEQECSREIFADEAHSVVAAPRSNFIR